MLAKRIIPCLDIRNGRTVKGVNFKNITDAGCPLQLAEYYAANGADELTFLDIMATLEGRDTFYKLVKEVAAKINIPFTVGGGINSINVVYRLLKNGADKISVNSYAVSNSNFINVLSKEFGSQCVVVAIDVKKIADEWFVFTHSGTKATEIRAIDYAKQLYNEGAGEILLTSMNNDGTQKGFALDITKQISESINIPVIASGGAGCMQDFKDVFIEGKADAALAASIFHFNKIQITELKQYLNENNIIIRK